MERITSRENARIKRVSRLMADKAERAATRLFVVEGARLCADAVESGVEVREAYVTAGALSKYRELTSISCMLEKASEVFEVSDEVAAKISDTKTPQGIFAVCSMLPRERPGNHAENARYLLLSSLGDPGNVGTIIRTAEAFGFDGIALSGDCPDIYSPKVLRATMGGAFRLRTWTSPDMLSEITGLRQEGVRVYAAAVGETTHMLGDFAFEGACAAVLGNEGSGLCPELITACDGTLTIPMAGGANSLGVAMAAGILAWEMSK